MVKRSRTIVWDKQALDYFKAAIKFIRRDSPQNAELVKNKIREAVNDLPDNPQRYPADKYRKKNKDDSYRAFEIYRFRIAYFVSKDQVRIIRIRHTSQEPQDY
jgi:plasmid stabilization system protein ParE